MFELVTHSITFIKKAEAFDELRSPTKRTSDDPSKCSRAVPMEVMCLGMPRTGTSCPFPRASSLYSIREALILLGYDDCYHMATCTKEKPNDCRMWCDALDGKMGIRPPFAKEDWDMLLGHYRAVTDNPCTVFSEELYKAYPDAKIILSVRDSPDTYYRSVLESTYAFTIALYGTPSSLLTSIKRHLASPLHFDTFFKKLTDATDFWDFPQNGKDRYLQHNEMIRTMVPREQLLEFNVKEGWAPLCAFLGKPVPDDVPFPRVNEKAHLQMVMRRILRFQAVVAIGKSTVVGVVVTGLVYLARGRVWL